ncbi:MAG: hypothetical protein II992_10080 [Lachnospiraceae bacterium]|nr:hypothetical protein [Lachnospiraceae bacterium]
MGALKDELDKIAQMEVEMETNETYQKIGAIEVEDVETPGSTKTLSDIISDNTARSSAYDTAVTKATNSGGWYLTATGVDAAAGAYKSAFENALKSGKTIDEAKEDEKVVEAREALYGKFATDLKNTTGALGGNITVGNTAFTNANKVSEAAAEAFDTICEAAEKLAATELMKEEAFKDAEGEVAFAVTDLFGNSKNQDVFEIASGLDAENNLKITLKNKEGEDTVITIANADKLLAGDVITITSEKMTETKSAATGKEAFRLQVGANAGQEVSLGINSMRAKDLDIVQTKLGVEGKALDVSSQATASLAVNAYDMAIQKVSTERAKMGAMQNRLEHTIANLDASAENLQAAESSLRDTDMAEEMTQYSKNNILMQAGQSMLAQANQSNQGVLSLLG